jgi:hypothetical protein
MKHMYVAILAVATLSACGSIDTASNAGKSAEYVPAEEVTGSRLPGKKKKEAPVNMAGEPITSGQPKN